MAAETAISFGQEQEVPRGKWEREKHFSSAEWGSLRIPKMKRQAATQKATIFVQGVTLPSPSHFNQMPGAAIFAFNLPTICVLRALEIFNMRCASSGH